MRADEREVQAVAILMRVQLSLGVADLRDVRALREHLADDTAGSSHSQVTEAAAAGVVCSSLALELGARVHGCDDQPRDIGVAVQDQQLSLVLVVSRWVPQNEKSTADMCWFPVGDGEGLGEYDDDPEV